MIRRGRAPRRPPMYADRVTALSARRVVRSQAALCRLQEWICRDIGAWLYDNGFDLNTDCSGRWFPQYDGEYIVASRFASRLHGMRACEGAWTEMFAPLTWPSTREGLRAAIAWCEAKNATMQARPAVRCASGWRRFSAPRPMRTLGGAGGAPSCEAATSGPSDRRSQTAPRPCARGASRLPVAAMGRLSCGRRRAQGCERQPRGARRETGRVAAMIEWIETMGIGPSSKARVAFAPRLNVLRGPNGCGKTFILDQIWWAIAGSHIAETAWPLFRDAGSLWRLNASLRDSRSFPHWVTGEWSVAQQRWHHSGVDCGSEIEHVAVYVRSDGLYGFWEPFMPQPGRGDDEPLGDWLCLSERELWFGRRNPSPDAPINKHGGATRGMLGDIERGGRAPMRDVLTAMLDYMAPLGQRVELGEPSRFKIGDARDYPTLRTARGDLPITLAPESVRRVVSIAYSLAWWWREHTHIARAVNRSPVKNLVILCDDPLRGLDSAWRSCFTRGLLEAAARKLAPDGLNVQLVMTTTAPSKAFTGEEWWNRETDQVSTLRPTTESLVAYTRR